jgi:hypothetical protein
VSLEGAQDANDFSKAGAKVLLFSDMCKFLGKKMQIKRVFSLF